jgi:hypothetical protein
MVSSSRLLQVGQVIAAVGIESSSGSLHYPDEERLPA